MNSWAAFLLLLFEKNLQQRINLLRLLFFDQTRVFNFLHLESLASDEPRTAPTCRIDSSPACS